MMVIEKKVHCACICSYFHL